MDRHGDEIRIERDDPVALVGMSLPSETDWMKELLHAYGYRASGTNDLEVVPVLLRREEPVLVIIEMSMIFPGISAAMARLHQRVPDVRAVLILPEDIVSDRARQDIASALGFDHVLTRPLTPAGMSALMQRLDREGGMSLNGS